MPINARCSRLVKHRRTLLGRSPAVAPMERSWLKPAERDPGPRRGGVGETHLGRARRAGASRDHAQARHLYVPGLRPLHAVHGTGRGADRFRRTSRQPWGVFGLIELAQTKIDLIISFHHPAETRPGAALEYFSSIGIARSEDRHSGHLAGGVHQFVRPSPHVALHLLFCALLGREAALDLPKGTGWRRARTLTRCSTLPGRR
jgi:hypothetical protein